MSHRPAQCSGPAKLLHSMEETCRDAVNMHSSSQLHFAEQAAAAAKAWLGSIS